ncbi:Protein STB5 [Fusarium oxysporum f. sp. albedinis]|nr:Protein STB5 [Fusarium oxysporum f. sp. albedinis]
MDSGACLGVRTGSANGNPLVWLGDTWEEIFSLQQTFSHPMCPVEFNTMKSIPIPSLVFPFFKPIGTPRRLPPPLLQLSNDINQISFVNASKKYWNNVRIHRTYPPMP